MVPKYSTWLILIPHLGLLVRGFDVQVYFDSKNHLHRDIGYHPEQPERIATCVKAITAFRRRESHPAHRIQLIDIAPPSSELSSSGDGQLDDVHNHAPASRDEMEHARSLLVQTHNPELLT